MGVAWERNAVCESALKVHSKNFSCLLRSGELLVSGNLLTQYI